MQQATQILNGQELKLKLVFVSVDPDSDSGEKMETFVNLFDPNIIAVTGSTSDDPNLKDIMKKFRIYATKLHYEEIEDSR